MLRGVIPLLFGVASVSAQGGAQFVQQGSKLVGAGAVGFQLGGLGQSVALSADGNTAIVGGTLDNGGAGAAWVYTRSGGVWAQQGAKLVGASAVGGAAQGSSVALSADGNTAIVGGPNDNNGGNQGATGAAWVFTRSGGVWTQQGGKLVGNDAVNVPSGAQQGWAVALSADGNTAIVGGWEDNAGAGAAWVFARSGGLWTQQGSKLVGNGAVNGSYGAQQGWAVALSADGNTAIVGGPNDNYVANQGAAGAAWVYTRSEGSWTQQGGKLAGTGAVGSASQGYSVALSADGNTAILGGPVDNSPCGGCQGAGAVWVFARSAGLWAQQGGKLAGTGAVGPYSAGQGTSVALSGDGNTAIVGGPWDGVWAGAAWLFTRSGGAWTQQGGKLVGSGAVAVTSLGAAQGWSVALSADGSTAILGGPKDNANASDGVAAGAAWIFASASPTKIGTYNAGQWSLDMNGNGTWDGDPPDLSASFGSAGATYVTGDWNGYGHTKIGVYQDGVWRLDLVGNGVWDGGVIDKEYNFGWADPDVIPVVGDWNGDGRTKIGIYYHGFWYLDYDGNGIWDGGVNDKEYQFGWLAKGVTPMVGDWNGDGRAKIGIYYQGSWYLDYDGNGIWDGGVNDKAYNFGWAAAGVTPVMGDWNGDGRAKIGIYYNGYWYLDYKGDGLWDGGVIDKQYNLGWADSAVTPVVGDWSASGTAKIGVFYKGYWYLDFVGNGIWDGGVIDKSYVWGQSGDTPIVGKW